MFAFKRIPDVTLDVEVNVPGLPGKAKLPTLKVKYRLLSVSEQKEVFEAPADQQPSDDDLIARDLLDFPGGITWQDVDDDGNPNGKPYQREFSQDLLAELMDIGYMREALVKGWLRAQSGAAQARQKN